LSESKTKFHISQASGSCDGTDFDSGVPDEQHLKTIGADEGIGTIPRVLDDRSVSRRNKMFWHTARDDAMFTAMRCISRHEDTQVYGTILPKDLTNQATLESKAYKTYFAFASGEKTPKPKDYIFFIWIVEAARTMLIFSRASLFLWAEAIATACFTQNRSIIHRRFNKTPYELINGRKPDISSLHVFGALCYPKNDRVDNTKTGRPQPRSNTKHDRHCLISVNHDICLRNYVNGKNSHGKKHKENVSIKEKQKKHQPQVKKPKKVGFIERLTTPKPRKPRFHLRWSPTGRLFDQKGKIVDSSESESQFDCSNSDNACTSNTLEPKIKRFPNSTSLLGRNDHVAAILGFGDLQWGNILITRVYFVEGLGHNLFLVGQFCDSDLEVAFRRNACFVRNLDGVDLLKDDLARNNLISGLLKFKYHKEHLCPSCEQGKRKRASHPPKPVPNSRQILHLLHMDLCGPMRITSINGKRYVLVIVDDYSSYTWVRFLISKDEAPEVIKTFLKRINVLLQSPVIIIRTDNGTKFKNQVLKEYFDTVGISHQMSFVYTPQQNRVVERQNWTLVEAARTISKPGLQSMTSGQISSGLDLTYAPSTITTQQPTEGELDLLFEDMYDDYVGGQPSATARIVSPAQEPQVRQTSTASISIAV
nr:hypothetical protein [Tanacetum cinerariifolium]